MTASCSDRIIKAKITTKTKADIDEPFTSDATPLASPNSAQIETLVACGIYYK